MQHHPQLSSGKALSWSLAITVAFVAVEFVAGLKANSLALLSDAGHNFTDALALMLAWVAFYFESKPADEVKTYGYHRAGILAAFINALSLIGLAAYVLYESYLRLRKPQPVDELTMLVVALAGLGVNLGVMWALHHRQKQDLNVRAAYMHMLGDALSSVGIIAGALLIRWTSWYTIDPLLSALIGGLIIWTAWDIVRETLNILLEGLPRGLTLEGVRNAILEVPGVCDVHDLHIWSLGSRIHALSCHVVIPDIPPSESEPILQRINYVLAERFGVHHTTIQFEHAACPVSEVGCWNSTRERSRALASEPRQVGQGH